MEKPPMATVSTSQPTTIRERHVSEVRGRLGVATLFVVLGRIFFSLIFILSSFRHFSAATIEYAAQQGAPAPHFWVPVTGLLALVGGLSVLFGYRARFGAFLLIVFLIPVTLTMHRFWATPDATMAMIQQVMFMKNLSMLGGAFLIFHFGSGPGSLK